MFDYEDTELMDAATTAREMGDYEKSEELVEEYYDNVTHRGISKDPIADSILDAIWNGEMEWK